MSAYGKLDKPITLQEAANQDGTAALMRCDKCGAEIICTGSSIDRYLGFGFRIIERAKRQSC